MVIYDNEKRSEADHFQGLSGICNNPVKISEHKNLTTKKQHCTDAQQQR